MLAGTAIALATGPSAFAGGRPLPVSNPAYNWGGFYAGGNIGYGAGLADADLSATFLTPAFLPVDLTALGTSSATPRGAIGGLQLGYNWQPTRHWVFGVEADFQWSGQRGSRFNAADFNVPISGYGDCEGCGSAQTNTETKLNWVSTIRQRTGYAWNNLLFYSTSGLALGRVSVSGTANATVRTPANLAPTDCEGGCSFAATFNDAKTRVGWTAGAGVEGAAGLSGWTWRAEYLYIDLGTVDGTAPLTGTSVSCRTSSLCVNGIVNTTATHHVRVTDNVVRFGLNYRFGAGPPPPDY